MDDKISEIDCIRVVDTTRSILKERVASETTLELWVNEKYITSFIQSVGLEDQLVTGHLISTGMISDQTMIKQVVMTEREGKTVCKVEIASTRTNRRKSENLDHLLTHKQLLDYLSLMKDNQHLHMTTRGFHAALLYVISTGEWFMTEDIGRHNAVDKVIGWGSDMKCDFSDCILFLTGRLVSDIVTKAVNSNIPLIASMTVATDKGIQIAEQANITLVGSLSNNGFWLYNEGRVKILTD